ncbi:hypothetical protein [Urechidicola vernalis]|uniref:START domain-containing protein n=1 Tax=Urechidicola vernalis TaxID=3075600 RepID=A0ABU2Y133_9FLAO|nr:hypothetical protein [Urechidicola sp. P050]MDT0551888.1 hypothetical protein [Urechidicola sp. P050]
MLSFQKYLLFVFIAINSFGYSQENWELIQDKDEIFIYTRNEENTSFKAFKAQLEMNTSIHRFVYEIQNLEGFKDWGYKIKEVNLLERQGDTVQIYYAESKAPFPFKNRDGIYKNTFRWNSELEILSIPIAVLHEYLPEKENNVRVKGIGYWEVTKLAENKLQVIFQMSIDPGGGIPAWLSNIFITDSPYSTLINLKKLVEKPIEKDLHFNFLN